MSDKEPQPFNPETKRKEKVLSEKEIEKIIKFIGDEIWPLFDNEKKEFPKQKRETKESYDKRVLDTESKLRKARDILVAIYKAFPHLKPTREQQRDMGIYDLLIEDYEEEK